MELKYLFVLSKTGWSGYPDDVLDGDCERVRVPEGVRERVLVCEGVDCDVGDCVIVPLEVVVGAWEPVALIDGLVDSDAVALWLWLAVVDCEGDELWLAETLGDCV